MSDPWVITDDVRNAAPLTPRFAIRESRGGGPAKIRSVDDFWISGVNDLVSMQGADIPQNIDVSLASAVLYRSIAPIVSIRAFAIDYSNAYKNAPLCREKADLSTIGSFHLVGRPALLRWGRSLLARLERPLTGRV